LNIVVCVKRVAEHAEAEFEVDEEGRLRVKGAAYDVNEWDDYALEEALRIKESRGGKVTVVSVGDEGYEEALRKCLAKGADEAIRVAGLDAEMADPLTIARALHAVIKGLDFDLVLTGAQASDNAYAAVGPALAELLGVPYASLVKRLEVLEGGWVRVHRELEGGVEEVVELRTPALLTIQTGINEPRYVSIMGIRRASKKPLKVVSLGDLGLSLEGLASSAWFRVVRFSTPKAERRAEIIEGPADRAAERIIEILRERGLLR